ncbi:MAG: hypothetical protein PHV93_03760 [Candidatus Pacebacteria bacterium]|nr:hypothetical protein [Candidatus Paceibacterota bacterium]
MKQYVIHDLIKISVSEGVPKMTKKGIDFQIEHFSVLGESERDIPYLITVLPYSEYKKPRTETFSIFHGIKGIQGKEMLDESKMLAVEKTETGYTIYTGGYFLINTFIQLILVKEGYSMIHAACIVDSKGRGLLLPGAGGVGKTSILGHLLKKEYRALGDDIVIAKSDGECLSFPRSFVLKSYHQSIYPELFEKLHLLNSKKKIIPSLLEFIRKNAPFTDLTKKILKKAGLYKKVYNTWPFPEDQASVPISEIFGENAITERAQIKKIVFLERYEGKDMTLQPIKNELVAQRMFSIINHELASEIEFLCRLGAYELAYIDGYFQTMSNTIQRFVRGADCSILKIPVSTSPEELAEKFESLCLHP